MAQAAVRAQIHKALDRLLHLAAQIAFHFAIMVQHLANPDLLVGCQIIAVATKINLSLVQYFVRCSTANAEDTSQRNLHSLVARQFDTRNSCHRTFLQLNPDVVYAAGSSTRYALHPRDVLLCSSCKSF
jgi:hypothetical protein